MDFIFAPLQGYTDCHYRSAHHRVVGGMSAYITPFVRLEGGQMRPKDRRDVSPERNGEVPTIPQIIISNVDEFCRLCDELEQMGWRSIDVNMGCPFPMQTHAGRGCALLADVDEVGRVVEEMGRRREVFFSAKMRLGYQSPEEALRVVPILNDSVVGRVALHPRLGVQQYRGVPDMELFEQFYRECAKPLVYNGDLRTPADIEAVCQRFPSLSGVMIGRGLLADPTMVREYQGREGGQGRWCAVFDMHDLIFACIAENYCGDAQILTRMHAFWEYQKGFVPNRWYKKLMKSGNVKGYRAAYSALREEVEKEG